MNPSPLVTVMITARNRPEELEHTLKELRGQTYTNIELLVMDDASQPSLESIVRRHWPDATFIRNEACRGLIANRSQGMQVARGRYVLSLDDDSCFTASDDLARAIERMEREQLIGVITFYVFHGKDLPLELPSRPVEKYVVSFIGCGHLIRKKVIEQIGAYRDFFFYYGEEPEYSLRVLDAGWRILFFPSILVHHRVSQIGRKPARVMMFSFRNNLWSILLNMPARRAVVQTTWRFLSHSVECLRQLQVRAWLQAIIESITGLPRVLRMRHPIRPETLSLYDALRSRTITTEHELQQLTPPSFFDTVLWFMNAWRNRPRSRSFWDRRSGDLGKADHSLFAHQIQPSRSEIRGGDR